MKISTLCSSLLAAGVFFAAASAHATPVDLSSLDTIRTIQQKGPFGTVKWPGVALKVDAGYNGTRYVDITVPKLVRVDGPPSIALDKPQTTGLTRIFQNAEGGMVLEHVDVVIDGETPQLQITSRSTVRLVEVARVQDSNPRAKPIPVYAYRSDAKHVKLVVAASGQSIGKNDSDDSCKASRAHACTFGVANWQDSLVDIELGAGAELEQARGDVVFESAPKGESNPARTYIVNASFTQAARDPAPLLSISTRTMETVFRGDLDGE